MSRPISNGSRQPPIPPQRQAAQGKLKTEVPRTGGDNLQLGRALPPSLIEADLRLSMVGSTAVAGDGTVTLQRAFLDRLLRHALAGSQDIQEARIGFDVMTGTYTLQAKASVKGISVPLSLKFAPIIDQNQIGLQFREVAIPTRFGSLEANLLTRKVTEAVAQELAANGFANSTDPRNGLIRLDANALLGEVGVLPSFASLDLEKTRLSVKVALNGNVVVGMKSDQPAPASPDTPASDIAVFADARALQQALRGALGPDYELQKLTLDNGHLKLDGRAEYKEGSGVVNGAKALFLLMALASGDSSANRIDTTPERLMVPLGLDVKQDGTHLVITPSLTKALDSLSESLQKAGLTPVRDGKEIRVDLNELWKGRSAAFDQIRVQQDGASARLHLDIDSFFESAWLTGGAE